MRTIGLSNGQITLVDDADYELVSQYRWNVESRDGRHYARTNEPKGNGKYGTIYLHRLILGDSCKGKQVEFINGNTLDSRRENLRARTRTALQLDKPSKRKNSTSSYNGVFWNATYKKWCTSITIERTHIYLGSFHSEVEAASVYQRAHDIRSSEPNPQSAIEAIKQLKPVKVKTPKPPKPVKVRIPKAPKTPKPVKVPKPPKPVKVRIPKAPKVKIPKAKTIKVVAPLPDNPMVSKYKGVYYDKGYWVATIKLDGQWNTLGSFLFEDDAATAYDDAAIEALGDTAILNFPINS
jgi:hypothetical protein